MNYKAIDILKTFSEEEMNECGKFIHSPYFVENSKVVKLFDVLAEYHPDFDDSELSDEWLYKKLNPRLEYKKETIRKNFQALSIALERYLVQKNFESKSFEQYDNLYDALMKKNLHRYAVKCLESGEEILSRGNALNADHFLNAFKHTTNKANYLISSQPRSSALSVEEVTNAISDRGYNVAGFFLKEMLRCMDNLLTFDKNFNLRKEKYFVWNILNSFDLPVLFEIMKANSKSALESAVCNVYCSMYLAFKEFDNDAFYEKYKIQIRSNEKFFSHDEMRFHILRQMRYCLMKIAAGKRTGKFENELFEIYVIFTSKGYYKASIVDYLSVEAFRPILNLGLKLKKYKWTLEFINTFKNKLPPDRRRNMFHYASALYFFHTGKHSESMRHSQKVEFDHFLFKLDLRDLMLMTLFEMNAFENALSHIDTYKHFLNNDKTLAEAEKKRHRNFIDIVQKFIEYINEPEDSIEMKIQKLMNEEHSNKEWIKEKADMVRGENKKTG